MADIDEYLNKIEKAEVTEADLRSMDVLLKDAPKYSDEGESVYEKAGRTGEFNVRDAVGQHFARVHKKGTEEYNKYNALESRAEKKTLPRSVGKNKIRKCCDRKKFQREFSEVEQEKGIPMTFGALVVHYGGWACPPRSRGPRPRLPSAHFWAASGSVRILVFRGTLGYAMFPRDFRAFGNP